MASSSSRTLPHKPPRLVDVLGLLTRCFLRLSLFITSSRYFNFNALVEPQNHRLAQRQASHRLPRSSARRVMMSLRPIADCPDTHVPWAILNNERSKWSMTGHGNKTPLRKAIVTLAFQRSSHGYSDPMLPCASARWATKPPGASSLNVNLMVHGGLDNCSRWIISVAAERGDSSWTSLYMARLKIARAFTVRLACRS